MQNKWKVKLEKARKNALQLTFDDLNQRILAQRNLIQTMTEECERLAIECQRLKFEDESLHGSSIIENFLALKNPLDAGFDNRRIDPREVFEGAAPEPKLASQDLVDLVNITG